MKEKGVEGLQELGEEVRGKVLYKCIYSIYLYICMYVCTKCDSQWYLVIVCFTNPMYVIVAIFPLSMHQASCGNKLEDKAKEVKDQYTSELSKLQKELKQLKAAKKEHQKALKQQASTDRELKALKKDLEDMKKQRVKLMHKMRDEATRNRQEVGIGGVAMGCRWGGVDKQ